MAGAGVTGTIVRIKCRNFLTYDSMEVYPGDKLNVIIGPNGTGKSTLACAIVLGLGGKPTVIGRAKQLSAFVKYGESKASVEIELFNPDAVNYIIKRVLYSQVFDNKNESKWNVNGRQTTEQQVKSLVAKLNIQIDNLCQFLPQDRVQDFAKMNKQQLFYNTLKSIGGIEMENTIDKLKDLQKNFTSLKKTIESKSKSLDQETIDNQRLEGEVENSNERKKLVDHIELMNKKKSWLLYDDKCKEKETLKQEADAIRKKYESEKLIVKPMEDKLKQINQNIKNVQARIAPLSSTRQKNFSVVMKFKEECARVRGEIELVEDQIKNMGDEEADIQKEIESKKMLLSVAANDTKCCNEEEVKAQVNDYKKQMQHELDQGSSVKNTKSRIDDQIEKIHSDLAATERRLQRIQNVKYQRETLLSELSEDALKATKWLRENRHLFSGEIYEPMLLEINVNRPEYARHTESLISRDDLLAFTCEMPEDAGILLKEFREVRKWRVNIIIMPDARKRQSIPSEPYPISQLKKFGFDCYASDIIEAPDSILTYLHLNYNLKTIPIGGKEVNTHHYNSTIPSGISRYLSDESLYSVFTSRYSGNVISSTNPLKRDVEYFKASADPDMIAQLRSRINELNENKSDLQEQLTELDASLAQCQARYSEKRTVYSNIMQKLEQKASAEKRVKQLQEKIRGLEQDLRQHAGKETSLRNQIKANLTRLANASKKLPELVAAVISSEEKVELLKLSLNKERKKLGRYEAEFSEKKEALERIQKTAEEAVQRLNVCKQEAKRLYRVAMDGTDGISSSEEPVKSKFSVLSDDLETLDSRINQQKAKLACLPEVNDSVFQEYEARQKRIGSLQSSVTELSAELNSTEANIEAIKSTWLPEIGEYIAKINIKYSSYFREMNCAGEVSLHVPEIENDFENYGITIRVKFRGESDLKELDGHRQSGGERAVSTALYMLAMQGLTSVPFRLVDEINQGMDVVNERKVFQLLLRIVEHSSTSCQYFLITPKLLRDMEYSKDTNVICIYNGQHAMSHDQFNVANFIDTARRSMVV
uniref:Structural maintenance of chromosomes protein 5 n=1 Tax=Cacopsylla melanoneura TaxID=428564 RepID=A0A8D8Q0P2_9HEMI